MTSSLSRSSPWISTGRRRERLRVDYPARGIEMTTVTGSDRLWEAFHSVPALCYVPECAENQGMGAHWVHRRRFEIARSGSLMALQCGESHRTRKVTKPASFVLLRFDNNLLASMADELDLRGHLSFQRTQFDDNQPLTDLVRKLHQGALLGAPAVDLEGIGHDLIVKVLQSCMETRCIRNDPIPNGAARAMRTFLGERYAEGITLKDLEELTGLSSFHLGHLFTECFAVPPLAFCSLLRLAEARDRLVAGESASHLARELGYYGLPHFSRMFKKVYGLSPSFVPRRPLGVV
ncbi:MAG TPA: AraC family transcriptional regulator [Polyangiaceae bacterium]|nr:AraC family transcriptional regulator [Polyangiaceae bacterium]